MLTHLDVHQLRIQALEQMAITFGGIITDPVTSEAFTFDQVKKAFIV